MAVEMLILSGPRQGERYRLDGHRIVVGDVEEADVAFHSSDSAAARGRHATLDSSEQGWTLTNRGGGDWLVNQTPVSSGQSTRLRSGDVVRLSEEGPDFRFSIVSVRDPCASSEHAAVESVAAERQDTADSTPEPKEDGSRQAARRANPAMFGVAGLVAIAALSSFAVIRFANSDAPPHATDDTATVEVGKNARIAVLQNDQDNDQDEDAQRLTVCQLDTSSTAGTATINPDGTVAYDTAGKFDHLQRGQSGSDVFLYTIRDAAGHESQGRVHVQVVRPSAYNRQPLAVDDAQQVTAGGTSQLSVLGNDKDPDGDPLTVLRLALDGTKGTATIGTGGVIQYRAQAVIENANSSGTATDFLGYVVSDGHGGEATARVTITIAGAAGQRDEDALVNKLANGIVYLIVEINGQKFPLCTGWALRPDLIVSAATHLSVLQERRDNGDALFVGYGGAEPRFVPVADVFVHPLFDKEASESPVSRAHNVGLVTLKIPLPVRFQVTRAAALPKPPTGMKVAVLAYRLKMDAGRQSFNILDPPGIVLVRGTVRGMETVAGSTNDLPLLLLDANSPAGGEGAAVLDDQDKVIGCLVGPPGNRYVVLCDQLDPLLPDGR